MPSNCCGEEWHDIVSNLCMYVNNNNNNNNNNNKERDKCCEPWYPLHLSLDSCVPGFM